MKKKLNHLGIKLILIGVIVIILNICLGAVHDQESDRQYTYSNAQSEIIESAGGILYIKGPYITFPVVHTSYTEKTIDGKVSKDKIVTTEWKTITASSLKLSGDFKTQKRTVGIYTSPIFTGSLVLEADFNLNFVNYDEYDFQLSKAKVYIDTKASSLTERPLFELNGTEYETDNIQINDGFKIGTSYDLKNGKLKLTTTINFRGAKSFIVYPSAKDTKLSVKSDWTSPGFTSFAYLPDTHSITEDGFTAEWHIPFATAEGNDIIGFKYVEPVNLYQKLDRAMKYGILFIVVPFLVLFLSEIFMKIKLHPIHYLLSGVACVLFFLLLLSLSEHISFNLSYFGAALAASLLVSWYIAAVTGKVKSGITMQGAFILLYAYLYASLLSEDYALLIGSVFAFIILAITMFLTKKINWEKYASQEISSEKKELQEKITDSGENKEIR